MEKTIQCLANFTFDMSDNKDSLSASLYNQSEAGPDIVQVDVDNNISIMKDIGESEVIAITDGSDKLMKQPVNIVAPLKVENRTVSGQSNVLEVELAKLHEMLEKQEKLTQQRTTDRENQLSENFSQLCQLQDKIKQKEERERESAKKIAELTEGQAQLTVVMQDYEMLIGKLTAEIENDKKSKCKLAELEAEKEAALTHLHNVEAAFSDVHSKYEKCKKVVEEYKKNESSLKGIIAELKETYRMKEKTLENVQAHAAAQLDAVQRELQRLHMDHEQESTRLRAMLRKTEVKVMSLQESLDQKTKENQELTTICDDLIAGKGYNNRH